MTRQVPLDSVSSGAVLAGDLIDSRGNVLLARGTCLTAAHLALARRRGITSVSVVTDEEGTVFGSGLDADVKSQTPPPGDRLDGLLRRQAVVFSRVLTKPLMAAIYAAARDHLRAGNLPPE